MDADDIAVTAQLDADTVQRAPSTEPFFDEGKKPQRRHPLGGKPPGQALRVAGQWTSPAILVNRLLAALDAVRKD